MTLPSDTAQTRNTPTDLTSPGGPDVPPASGSSVITPRWAVRLELSAQDGTTRTVDRLSDATELADATTSVLERARTEFPDDTITGLHAFEPATIAAWATPATFSGKADPFGLMRSALAATAFGPR